MGNKDSSSGDKAAGTRIKIAYSHASILAYILMAKNRHNEEEFYSQWVSHRPSEEEATLLRDTHTEEDTLCVCVASLTKCPVSILSSHSCNRVLRGSNVSGVYWPLEENVCILINGTHQRKTAPSIALLVRVLYSGTALSKRGCTQEYHLLGCDAV
jgi:hypothetical protein